MDFDVALAELEVEALQRLDLFLGELIFRLRTVSSSLSSRW